MVEEHWLGTCFEIVGAQWGMGRVYTLMMFGVVMSTWGTQAFAGYMCMELNFQFVPNYRMAVVGYLDSFVHMTD
jgi:hypothetical protein